MGQNFVLWCNELFLAVVPHLRSCDYSRRLRSLKSANIVASVDRALGSMGKPE